MEKRKNMSLDDVNESINQELTNNTSKGKINSQKNDEIQKRLNNFDKNKRKAVTKLTENDFNTTLKQSSLFSDILNKVDLMDSRLVKQDEKITKIRELCYIFS